LAVVQKQFRSNDVVLGKPEVPVIYWYFITKQGLNRTAIEGNLFFPGASATAFQTKQPPRIMGSERVCLSADPQKTGALPVQMLSVAVP
jgi:hypothetical protein